MVGKSKSSGIKIAGFILLLSAIYLIWRLYDVWTTSDKPFTYEFKILVYPLITSTLVYLIASVGILFKKPWGRIVAISYSFFITINLLVLFFILNFLLKISRACSVDVYFMGLMRIFAVYEQLIIASLSLVYFTRLRVRDQFEEEVKVRFDMRR